MTVNVFTHYQNCVNLRALAEARGVRPKRKTLWARWGRPGRPKAPRRPALRLAARATLVGLVFVGGFSLASRDPAPVLFFSLALSFPWLALGLGGLCTRLSAPFRPPAPRWLVAMRAARR